MKNRDIKLANEQAGIYRQYYQPSWNIWRFTKSILGVFLMGSSTCAHNNVHYKPKSLR